jgi:hypothetical protein
MTKKYGANNNPINPEASIAQTPLNKLILAVAFKSNSSVLNEEPSELTPLWMFLGKKLVDIIKLFKRLKPKVNEKNDIK